MMLKHFAAKMPRAESVKKLTERPASKRPQEPPQNATSRQQILALQRLIVWTCFQKSSSPIALSRLAIAFCQLEERKRILRGLPLPGQLRPDLDPVQLAKAIGRQRQRMIDVESVQSNHGTFSEEPGETEPEAKQPAKEPSKESLLKQEGPHGVRGEGGEKGAGGV